MRVGLNLLFRLPGANGGVETYVRRLVDELTQLDTCNEYVLFMSREAVFHLAPRGNTSIVACPVDSSNRGGRYLWEQTRLPVQVRVQGIRVLHSMNYVGPVVCPSKTIVTFQDLSYMESIVAMSASRRAGLRSFSTWSAKRSDVVVTVSAFSKKSICSKLSIPDEKVRVIPSGPGWNSERPDSSDIVRVLDRYRIVPPFVTAFAGGYSHKNIPRMLKAFQRVCKDRPHRLVLIGGLPPNVEIGPPLVSPEFRERILHLGHIATDAIYPILAGSELFIFPSLYEGFGFPLLEAQQAGVAIACSNVTSIPEVAGGGAAYFDPLSTESIGDAIENCLRDSSLRARLVQAGFDNVSRFSWRESAKAYIRLYNELAA